MPRPELIFLHSVNGGGCNIRRRAVSESDLGGWNCLTALPIHQKQIHNHLVGERSSHIPPGALIECRRRNSKGAATTARTWIVANLACERRLRRNRCASNPGRSERRRV
jgi:hypothetical protein